MSLPILRVQQLQVMFPTIGPAVPVVDRLSFQLAAGESLGIVGESGSGKTMTALALMGLLPPLAQVQGQIWWQAANSGSEPSQPVDLLQLNLKQMQRYRGNHLAMIFQEPSTAVNPVFTCGAQLMETIRQKKGVSQPAARQLAEDLLQEVQLSASFLQRYPHQLSGGQLQRVAIALALCCDPQLLIADEPTTALDVTVQAGILKLLQQLQQQRGMSLIFITHDLGVIAEIADQVVVMYRGKAVESGTVSQIFQQPQHPYTQGLLACRPQLDRRLQRLPTTDDFMTVQKTPAGDLEILAKGIATVEPSLRGEEAPPLQERLQRLQQHPPLLSVRHLKTSFPVRQGIFRRTIGEIAAVDDISFDLYPGETLGLVGESGSGKSTLGRTILRLVKANAGEIIYDGDDLLTLKRDRLRRLRRELQLIFQDPFASLDPRMSVADSVMEPMVLHHLGRTDQDRRQRARDLFVKVGLDPQALDRMPHEFSGGQRQRICIARALASEPRLLICDEAVSALDVSVQAQVLNLLKQLQADLNLTMIFISHDLSVVKFISDRILVMWRGHLEELAAADQLYANPQSSYTRTLIAAIPQGKLKNKQG